MIKWIFALAITCLPLFAGVIEDPEAYRNNSQMQLEWAAELIGRIDLAGDERILDIGAGDGKVTARMANLVPTGFVIGLDLSSAMNQYASQHHRRHNLTFVKVDLASGPFTQQFDLVTANCALMWIPDQKAVFASIYKSLVPGGQMIAVQPGADRTNLSPAAQRVAATPRWAPYFPGFQKQRFYLSPEECKEHLTEAGFELVHMSEIPTRDHYPSIDAFIEWIRPLSPFANHLPRPQRDQFLRDVATEMVTTDADGTWRVYKKLEVIARRPVNSRDSGAIAQSVRAADS